MKALVLILAQCQQVGLCLCTHGCLPPLPVSDADDPDLDALLADLCQLEEDTKTQLANTTASTTATMGGRDTIDFGGPSSLR